MTDSVLPMGPKHTPKPTDPASNNRRNGLSAPDDLREAWVERSGPEPAGNLLSRLLNRGGDRP